VEARVNEDLRVRAVAVTAAMPWTRHFGMTGYEVKLLEAAGDRRTALIRLPMRSPVPMPITTGAVDILVLAGDVHDGAVMLPTGTFIHRAAHAHQLVTESGCTLFVKHRPAREVRDVSSRDVLDTRFVVFEPSHSPGLWQAPLYEDDDGRVVLLQFDPGTYIETHLHDDGEEFFVLAGSVTDEHGSYELHTWVRQPPDSVHAITAGRTGCMFLTFAHHLQGLTP
jgi:quercetin dioxygenase-like cupin family protein